ncbi:hypothetical protein MMG00_03420 [Ignatzschineria rhizosphaerae]|uniref:DUF1311 domain-containing protein n=1 Tax=Ignatzschineria rhizosphaerae TaxID=2923279 RepID=A0ABY3X830_9GAMM|nr:hypothetical protein [Ignatzschineria rhizosphaerae]UNM96915.1 hypothetical protein MMG00_03420 [Ignatzschineria rhizosphaerae]
MKKMLIIGILGGILIGCGDRDETYFFENQKDAKETLKACEKRLETAITNGNEKEFKATIEDAECVAADSAIKKQRQLTYEKEQAERERLRKIEEVKRLQVIAEAKAKIVAEHTGKSWQQNISEYFKKECTTGFMQTPTIECAAWEEYYHDAVTEGKRLLSQFSFDELKAKKQEFCNLDQRRGSACSVWTEARDEKGREGLKGLDLLALERAKMDYCDDQLMFSTLCQTWKNVWNSKSDELVKLLTNDDDLFMENYNTCFNEIQQIQNSDKSWFEKSDGESAIRNMSPCTQAATAYQRRGMGYNPYQQAVVK